MRKVSFLFGALVLGCSFAHALAFDVVGKVVYVDDGDTLSLLVDGNRQMKVRLASIDAPEIPHVNQQRGRIGQPYSEPSGRFLAGLVKGREVHAHCFETDRYQRNVCDLRIGGKSVNEAMVASGFAWANTSSNSRYLRNRSLVDSQRTAAASKVGLWAGRNPVEPWEWRDKCWKHDVCPQ